MSVNAITIDLAGSPREDSSGLLWIHGLSRARIDYNGKPFPFDDAVVFGEVFDGLSAQINEAQHHPNYQVDEDLAGHNRGRRTSIAGAVRQVRRVSQSDLAAQGVSISEPEAIMFGVELNAYGRELKAKGQLRFSSLGLNVIRADERLNPDTNSPIIMWSAFLREMSGTGQPYLKHLRPIEETEHLQLAEKGVTNYSDYMMMNDEQLAELAKRLKPLMMADEPSPDMAELNQYVDDAEGSRSEVLARLATAAGIEVGAVEAILAGTVTATDDQVAAMKAVLMPPAEAEAVEAVEAMAELAVVQADNQALRADFANLRAERKREKTQVTLLDRARTDRVRVDFSATENAKAFELLCSQFEDDVETFEQLWARLSRDQRDGGGRAARAPQRASDQPSFSAMPRTPEEVEANKIAIEKHRAEHDCSFSEASAALKLAASRR